MSDYSLTDQRTIQEQQAAPPSIIDAVPGSPSSVGSADIARDEAADVKDKAMDAGQHVAGVAKEQTGKVAAEAQAQAKDLLAKSQEELRSQAAQQQQRAATGLHSLAQELHAMAEGSEDPGFASDLVREAARRTSSMADWLSDREPGELLDEVRSFARQRPGTFLSLAAAAGLVTGRLGRGLKEGAPEEPRHAADRRYPS
jgi:hypothetical protein